MVDFTKPIQVCCLRYNPLAPGNDWLFNDLDAMRETHWVDVTHVAHTQTKVLVWFHTREREAQLAEFQLEHVRNAP